MRKTGMTFQRSFWLSAWGHASPGWMRVLAAVLTLAGGAVLSITCLRWIELDQHRRAASEQLNELRSRQAIVSSAPAPRLGPPRYTAQQLMQFNAVIRQLNTPWSDVLDAFERHTPVGVALVLVEPDPSKRSVRVQAEAKEVDALFAYVDLLASDPAFAGVVPLQHETNEQDPNRPARFGFDLRLRHFPEPPRRQP